MDDFDKFCQTEEYREAIQKCSNILGAFMQDSIIGFLWRFIFRQYKELKYFTLEEILTTLTTHDWDDRDLRAFPYYVKNDKWDKDIEKNNQQNQYILDSVRKITGLELCVRSFNESIEKAFTFFYNKTKEFYSGKESELDESEQRIMKIGDAISKLRYAGLELHFDDRKECCKNGRKESN